MKTNKEIVLLVLGREVEAKYLWSEIEVVMCSLSVSPKEFVEIYPTLNKLRQKLREELNDHNSDIEKR